MNSRLDAARVRIEVPDARTAFRLEHRLVGLRPISVGRGPRWEVDVEEHGGAPEAIAEAVREWLCDVGLDHTTMWIDGAPTDVRR